MQRTAYRRTRWRQAAMRQTRRRRIAGATRGKATRDPAGQARDDVTGRSRLTPMERNALPKKKWHDAAQAGGDTETSWFRRSEVGAVTCCGHPRGAPGWRTEPPGCPGRRQATSKKVLPKKRTKNRRRNRNHRRTGRHCKVCRVASNRRSARGHARGFRQWSQ